MFYTPQTNQKCNRGTNVGPASAGRALIVSLSENEAI